MKLLIVVLLLAAVLVTPVSAAELKAPPVPESGSSLMPDQTESFSAALDDMLRKALTFIRPDLKEAASSSLAIIASALIVALVQSFSKGAKTAADFAGTTAIASILLFSTNSLIQLGADTIAEIGNYGKLLLPVMTSALAAQGHISTSAALYTGSSVFLTALCSLITRILLPMVYIVIVLNIAAAALSEETLKKMRDMIKNAANWCLKTILTVFTTYISLTGIVSGTTDAAALKATKITIASVVPVVGGILSDASEAVLVSTGIMKNAAGVYGILASLAIFLEPFLRIGSHYLLLKLSSMVCSAFGTKATAELVGEFASAMGLLLAMTASVCLLLLISTVCFMRGVT